VQVEYDIKSISFSVHSTLLDKAKIGSGGDILRRRLIFGKNLPSVSDFSPIGLTQNPIEYEGTFPLPEAQLDRFMMRIRLGYPARADEIAILTAQKEQHPIETISEVISADGLRDLQASVARTHVDRLITEYVVDVATATRDHQEVYLGASPRGSSALLRAAQARAVIQGRDFVSPDDVKALAESTLAHRLIVSPGARMRNVEPRTIIRQALDTVPVPGARAVRV
jgi:MoxR-like ATPase